MKSDFMYFAKAKIICSMIQRIQTLFLILAAVCFIGLFKFPFATSNVSTGQFLTDQVYNVLDHPVLSVIAGLGGLLALINIFLYKKRATQMRIGYLVIVLSILLLIVSYLLFTNDAATISSEARIDDGMGMFLPVGALIFVLIANYFIKKDDKIVKSMDRLR